jgi:NAD(P)-dependent dehydrogenase (short-subunit alcohol dehydrogenase family)
MRRQSILKPLLELEISDVEKVWAVALWGVFHCSQLAARRMVAQGSGGSIVVISSVHTVRAFRFPPHTMAPKPP